MATENNYNGKIYLVCLFSTCTAIVIHYFISELLNPGIYKHILNRYPHRIANMFLFHLALMHLLYSRLKIILNSCYLDKLIIYGAIYGYVSSVFSYLYSEIFFFLEPFSLFGFERMVNYVALLFARNSSSEFFIGTFTTPIIYMGWIDGVLISILILLIIRHLTFLNISKS